MKVVHLAEVPKVKVEMEGAKGAYKQLVLSSGDGVPGFSFRVFTVEPGGHTPFHRHASEHLNYIIEGRGTLHIDGRDNAVEAGSFAYVPSGSNHQFQNSGKGRFRFICIVPEHGHV